MSLPQRWFRTRPDSSELDRPRLLARRLIELAGLDEQISYYERLLGVAADLRMPIPDFGGLELAAVGNLLLIASERPFTEIQRRTAYSLIVPSLAEQLARLPALGARVLEPREAILPGSRARVRYPDTSIAELVEHRPQPGELAAVPAQGAPTGVRLLARKAVADNGFDHVVAMYARALAAPARVWRVPGAGPVSRLAVVGTLLVVGSTTPPSAGAPCPAFALLVTSPRALEGLVGSHSTGQSGGPAVVTVADGSLAEVWDPGATGGGFVDAESDLGTVRNCSDVVVPAGRGRG